MFTEEDSKNRHRERSVGSPLSTLIHRKPASFNQEPFSYHWDHNIQCFPGLPQTIPKRPLRCINTHFGEMCICLLGLRKGEERRGTIMIFCHPFHLDGQRQHSQCTGEKKAWWSRAAGMQSMWTHLIFLRGCALANDGLFTCSTGWSTESEKVCWYHQWGYESKHKNEGLPNCAKGGEKGLKMLNWRKEKVVNSKKLKKLTRCWTAKYFVIWCSWSRQNF